MDVPGYSDLVEIGRGAFATVYRARQVALDREVALKVLSANVLDDDARRRFDREGKAVAGLGWHPHVLPIYEAGQTGSGHPFLAMELITGGSLADLLRRDGPLPEQDALTLAVQVADALAAAHEAGVVHRDVKPGNVLIGRFGEAKLADFGVAMVGGSSSTTGESLSGTLGFMAPELLDGRPSSPSSDVYALAATLHLMLTGQAVFRLRTDETPLSLLNRIAREPVPDPGALGVTDGCAALIVRAMSKDPAQRFPSALAFIDAAERVLVRHGWELVPTFTPRPTAPAPPPPPSNSAPRPPVAPADPVAFPTPSLQPPEPTYRSYVAGPGRGGARSDRPTAAAGSPSVPRPPGAPTAPLTDLTISGLRATMGRSRSPGPSTTPPAPASGAGRPPTPVRSTPAAAPAPARSPHPGAGPRVPVAAVVRPGPEPPKAATGDIRPMAPTTTTGTAAAPATAATSSGRRRWRFAVAAVVLVAVVVAVGLALAGRTSGEAADRCPEGSLRGGPLDIVDQRADHLVVNLELVNECAFTQRVDDPQAAITLTDDRNRTVAELRVDLAGDPAVVEGSGRGTITLRIPWNQLTDVEPGLAEGFGWRYSMVVEDAEGVPPNDPGPLTPTG